MWIGGSGPAAEAFDAADIPSYATETDAVGGFMHLVRYRQSRELLMATPPSLPQDFVPDTAAVRPIIDAALARKAHAGSIRSRCHDCFRPMAIPITPAALARDRR